MAHVWRTYMYVLGKAHVPEDPSHVEIGVLSGDEGCQRYQHDSKVEHLAGVPEVSEDTCHMGQQSKVVLSLYCDRIID